MKDTNNYLKIKQRFEIRIAGSGGQGIVLAGIILAEAAILEGRYVAQSQSYGPETRGGTSTSEVIIGETEIEYPRAVELDLLVALTQEACDQNIPSLKKEGMVIIDSDLVQKVFWGTVISLPFQQIAKGVGEERAINMAALGAVVSFCPYLSQDSVAKAIRKRLPPSVLEANLKAFEEALKLSHRIKTGLKPVDVKEEFEI